MNLKNSANRVQEALQEQGYDLKVIELNESTRTAQEAASALGCQVAQIIKSLVFRTIETNQPVFVLASGINRVNENKIADYTGEPITKADADFTLQITGYAIGGIPPIVHKTVMKTFIDKDLMQFDELWAAAGTPNAVFCLQSTILPTLTKGLIVEIK